ncbi:type II toxin-antitoxin system HipA family toxin [Variovorax sp. YR216]|uniref:type II toxin-antitoxin system HipA family toxin n=1 Tax=Variovorax sp. YR216 TaxID=1882828 RepID=UPI00089A45CA|nr:type II toxin-antitoxin system HipA family toxin [Variovorax sp. YR216]SEB25368.1 serine/threonine-protein kinase HipA [Variovorax sp. YR216]
MKKLTVIYAGWGELYPLGELADNGKQLLFEYTPEAMARGLELSPLNLKLRPAAYGDFPHHQYGLPGLIADSLPDGWGLALQDKLFRKKGFNPARVSPLDRLALVNSNSMGALVFEPPQAEPLEKADVDLLALANEVRDVMEDESVELLRELVVMGGSPHGARPKVLVNYDQASGRMVNSEYAAGVPWLVKFQAENEHKEVCAIEDLYASFARNCGLDVPQTQYFDLDKKLAAFGIARFDRQEGQRAPIQTVAALLNANFRLPSSVDYTSFIRLTRFLTRDEREVIKAFERCVFNVVFNNRDDHAKNFSFRMTRAGAWQLSPAYDLTFCEGPGGEHQMDICGEALAPSRADLLKLAQQMGLKPKAAIDIIDNVVEKAGWFKAAAKNHAIRKATIDHISSAIEANRARMK